MPSNAFAGLCCTAGVGITGDPILSWLPQTASADTLSGNQGPSSGNLLLYVQVRLVCALTSLFGFTLP